MRDFPNDQIEEEIIDIEVTDESLEAAAFADHSGVYTQFGLCTVSYCPG